MSPVYKDGLWVRKQAWTANSHFWEPIAIVKKGTLFMCETWIKNNHSLAADFTSMLTLKNGYAWMVLYDITEVSNRN